MPGCSPTLLKFHLAQLFYYTVFYTFSLSILIAQCIVEVICVGVSQFVLRVADLD